MAVMHILQLVRMFRVVVGDRSRAIDDATECDIALEHSLPSGGPAKRKFCNGSGLLYRDPVHCGELY